jgi:hypothetical protein
VSILDTIDGALADYAASGDAMRWVPPGERTASAAPAWTTVTLDIGAFEAAMRQVGEVLAGLMRPWVDFSKSLMPVVEALNEVRAARVSAMHREYRRRAVARRRRR